MRSKWDPFDDSRIRDDLKGRSLNGGLYTLTGQVASFLLNLVRIYVLARLLSPEDFGLIAMVMTIAAFLVVLKDAGLSMATVQRDMISHKQVSSLFWINASVGTILGIALAASAPLIASFYGEPRLQAVVYVLSLSFPISGVFIQHQALMKRHMMFGRLMFIKVTATIVSLLVAILGANQGYGYWALVYSQLAQPVISLILFWLLLPWIPGGPNKSSGVTQMLKLGGSLSIDSFLKKAVELYPDALIGRVFTATELGFYSKAKQLLLTPLRQATSPLNSVAIPAMSRLTNDKKRYQSYFNSYWTLVRCIVLPVFCCAVVMYDWIIDIALGANWNDAKVLFLLCSIGAIFNFGIWPVGNLLTTQGRSADIIKLSLIRLPVRIIPTTIGALYSVEMIVAMDAFAANIMVVFLIWIGGRSGPVNRNRLVIGYLVYTIHLLAAIILAGLGRIGVESLNLPHYMQVGLVLCICIGASLLVISLFADNRHLIKKLYLHLLEMLSSRRSSVVI